MDKLQAIKNRLAGDGYQQIDVYTDEAHEHFADHTHDGDQLMVIVSGNIAVEMPDGSHNLTEGVELFVPSKTIHSATVGDNGCTYVVAEKKSE